MQRATAADWKKRVERWKDSGLSAKEFAAEMGFKASTLTYWSSRLRRSAGSDNARGGGYGVGAPTEPRPAHAKFVELPLAEVVASEPVLELVLQGDIRVRVPADFDERTLVRLMRAIGQVQ